MSLTFDQLETEVAKVMSLNTSVAGEAADILTVINEGLRNFYFPQPVQINGMDYYHQWTFLRPVTTLTTTTTYSTGTVAVASGVVTLTTGTWPSWAASGELTVSGSTYAVSTRDSSSQITLVDTSVTVAAGATYSLNQITYSAADNFGGLDGPMTFNTGSGKREILVVGEGAIREMKAGYIGSSTAPPRYVAVRPISTPLTGQRHQFLFFPNPDAVYIITYRYTVLMDKIATTQYPLGGMAHASTILASCRYVAALRVGDQELRMRRTVEWEQRLRASIMLDREGMVADHVGYNGSGEMWGDDGYRERGIVHNSLEAVAPPGY